VCIVGIVAVGIWSEAHRLVHWRDQAEAAYHRFCDHVPAGLLPSETAHLQSACQLTRHDLDEAERR
jgi:hypothetical protein